jgi:anti-sigma regulatory factor (Ser/Thr protein kinase)
MDPQSSCRVFPATQGGVADAAQWIEALGEAHEFPAALSYAIQLCIEELFTNLVRHGGGHWEGSPPPGAVPVSMSISITPSSDAVTVVLEDNGRPFDVAGAPPPSAAQSFEEMRPGGLGIKLVKEFSSELTYHRVGLLNRTTLKFRWPQAELSLL